MRPWCIALSGVLALPLSIRPALADDGGAAQALFDKGVADLEAGRFESACPALAESQRLDPRPGTLFALADCESELGKIASAVAHYQEYVGWISQLPEDQRARHDERVAIGRAQIEALQPLVPTLTLVVAPSAPAGIIVLRDGVVLRGAALGVALPLDPGEHVIATRAPGLPEESVTISVARGDAKVVEIPLRPTPAPPVTHPAERATPAPQSPPVPPPPGEDTTARSPSSQRAWGWVAGSVGAAGLVVGSVAGALAFDRKATVVAECPDGPNECSREGVDAATSGKRFAAVSTVSFGVGIAGIVTGAALVLTAPDERRDLARETTSDRGSSRWSIGGNGSGLELSFERTF